MKKILYFIILLALCFACQGKKQPATESNEPVLVGPTFCEDSAMAFCAAQCDFGPRVMNSEAHEKCAEWIANRFRQYGAEVMLQKADLKGWDGKMLHSTNIIASINPEAQERIIICAHWDSRPWADNDPDSTNWKKPVMAANDGASGIGVMLEMCRVMNANKDSLPKYGIDFVCFDAEDYGAPDWSGIMDSEDTWALGAQYFANAYKQGDAVSAYGKKGNVVGGILLDMVGGQGAKFYHEQLSKYYAGNLMDEVWQAAADAGYGSTFVNEKGGAVTDDHKPLNEVGIPTIDIISFYPDCEQSSFGPTWHTVIDDMQHLDKSVLKATGQSLIQFLYTR